MCLRAARELAVEGETSIGVSEKTHLSASGGPPAVTRSP